MALLGALCVGLNALGFTNRSLRAQVSRLLGTAYTSNQMSYDLARLRLNGLIERLTPAPTPTTSPPTGNESRSSTPKSTTGCSGHCSPPTNHRHPTHSEKRCAPSTVTSRTTSTRPTAAKAA